jgi:hypothetical protein
MQTSADLFVGLFSDEGKQYYCFLAGKSWVQPKTGNAADADNLGLEFHVFCGWLVAFVGALVTTVDWNAHLMPRH